MNGQHDAPVPEATHGSERNPAAAGQQAPLSQPAPQYRTHPQADQPAPGWAAPPAPGAPAPEARPETGWGAAQQSAGWGAPPAAGTFPKGGVAGSGKPWTLKRGLAVAGAAVVLAGGAGVGVYALSSSASANAAGGNALQGGMPGTGGAQAGGTQGGFPGGGMSGQGGPGNFAPDGLSGMGGLSAAVHSEFVVLQDNAYVTKVEQTGTVSQVSADSVTVKSADGFSRTYSLGSDVVVSNQQQRRQQAAGGSTSQLTVADIVSGAMVRIVAAKDSTGFPAETVQLMSTASTGSTGQNN